MAVTSARSTPGIATCPSGRRIGPKWTWAAAASITVAASSSRSSTVSAIEQQMSAEWKPGWIAFSAATTPPTGMSFGPVGQASGMIAPAFRVGTRRIASIAARTCATLAPSSSFSGSIKAA